MWSLLEPSPNFLYKTKQVLNEWYALKRQIIYHCAIKLLIVFLENCCLGLSPHLIYASTVTSIFPESIRKANEKQILTLSWRRPIPYRNQSIDLRSKSMKWFPYDIGLRHERVKRINWLLFSLKSSENHRFIINLL